MDLSEVGNHNLTPSLAERLRNAQGPDIGMNPDDVVSEIYRLGEASDLDGMTSLFDELISWETRFDGMGPGEARRALRTPQQIQQMVLVNIDQTAGFADVLRDTGGDAEAAYAQLAAQQGQHKIGRLQQFCREATSYYRDRRPNTPEVD